MMVVLAEATRGRTESTPACMTALRSAHKLAATSCLRLATSRTRSARRMCRGSQRCSRLPRCSRAARRATTSAAAALQAVAGCRWRTAGTPTSTTAGRPGSKHPPTTRWSLAACTHMRFAPHTCHLRLRSRCSRLPRCSQAARSASTSAAAATMAAAAGNSHTADTRASTVVHQLRCKHLARTLKVLSTSRSAERLRSARRRCHSCCLPECSRLPRCSQACGTAPRGRCGSTAGTLGSTTVCRPWCKHPPTTRHRVAALSYTRSAGRR